MKTYGIRKLKATLILVVSAGIIVFLSSSLQGQTSELLNEIEEYEVVEWVPLLHSKYDEFKGIHEGVELLKYKISKNDYELLQTDSLRSSKGSLRDSILQKYDPYRLSFVTTREGRILNPFSLFLVKTGSNKYDFFYPKACYNIEKKDLVFGLELMEKRANAFRDFYGATLKSHYYKAGELLKTFTNERHVVPFSTQIKEMLDLGSDRIELSVHNPFDDSLVISFKIK